MRLDKKFLARLLDIDETEITSISGLTFELANASEEIVSFKSLLNDRLLKRVQALTNVLVAEDDLGKVVRAHFYIEHELQDLIFFAAPSPDQLMRFDKMEFSEKVRLALILGLNAKLKAALTAAANLRNKFSHRLDMKLGDEEAKNLIATLPPAARQKFHANLQHALFELPDASQLKGEAESYFRVQSQVMVFFLTLFDSVAQERQRIAFEKLQTMAWH